MASKKKLKDNIFLLELHIEQIDLAYKKLIEKYNRRLLDIARQTSEINRQREEIVAQQKLIEELKANQKDNSIIKKL